MMSAPSISALTAGISRRPCTQARTKNPMKPSLTPCFRSNRSLYSLRSAITALMSTSLKVVSMAAVFCASLRRRAMVCRKRVMCTRSSRAASSGGEGARTCKVATGCATGMGAAAARSIAASMSPFVTRPSLPVPSTAAAARPNSALRRRTAGETGAAGAAGLGGGAAAEGAGACSAACGRGFSASTAIGLAADRSSSRLVGTDLAASGPSAIWPSSAPTATVSPSRTATSDKTPAAGAGTSIVTLSVSSSTSGSSALTASPAFLNQRPIVASVTDSPRVGTRISIMMVIQN